MTTTARIQQAAATRRFSPRRGLRLEWAGIAAALLLWEVVAQAEANPILQPPSIVLPTLARLLLTGVLWEHIATSALHVLLGFGAAAAVGFGAGLVMGVYPTLRAVMQPVIDAVRGVSAISLFPVILLLLGLGVPSKAFVIFWTAWPAILLNTAAGIWQVDGDLLDAARLDTTSRWTLTRYIALPLARPTLLTGLRIGLGSGWISLTAAEMLGGSRGLGFFILQSSQTFRFAEMYAAILTVALVGWGMNALLWAWQRRSAE